MTKDEIIKKVKSLELPLGEYAVFGSGPLAVRGIKEAHDIDMIVSSQIFEKLKQQNWEEFTSSNGDIMLHSQGIFEVAKDWNFGEYNPDVEKIISEAEIFEDVPFVKLEEVIKWKRVRGLEKDKKDLELVNEFLNSH